LHINSFSTIGKDVFLKRNNTISIDNIYQGRSDIIILPTVHEEGLRLVVSGINDYSDILVLCHGYGGDNFVIN
jgi:hypothetical protein